MHALPDSGHDGCCQIEGRVQHFFRNTCLPSVRQALIDSRLTVPDNGNRNADQFLFSIAKQHGGVGVAIIFTKISQFVHDKLLLLQF